MSVSGHACVCDRVCAVRVYVCTWVVVRACACTRARVYVCRKKLQNNKTPAKYVLRRSFHPFQKDWLVVLLNKFCIWSKSRNWRLKCFAPRLLLPKVTAHSWQCCVTTWIPWQRGRRPPWPGSTCRGPRRPTRLWRPWRDRSRGSSCIPIESSSWPEPGRRDVYVRGRDVYLRGRDVYVRRPVIKRTTATIWKTLFQQSLIATRKL